MKKIAIIFLGLMLSLSSFSQTTGDTIISNNSAKLKLKVLYFHITDRCNTCYSIEANVRKAIFENFETELDSGIIALSIMNCELKENEKIVEKYGAYGATLAITTFKEGKELKTEDLTNWAFKKIHNADTFISELKSTINTNLK